MATQKNNATAIQQLKNYVRKSPYICTTEQAKVCKSFELPYLKDIFRQEYRMRFYTYLFKNTTTCSSVEKATSIPQKYLTHVKAYYEKKGLLKVVGVGICPITKRKNVQFLSTNPQDWNTIELSKL